MQIYVQKLTSKFWSSHIAAIYIAWDFWKKKFRSGVFHVPVCYFLIKITSLYINRETFGVVAFPILANHRNISFLLDASLGQVCMSKMWRSNNSSARPRHQVEQSGDRQVVLNCRREGHFVFLSYKSTLLSAHCLFLL